MSSGFLAVSLHQERERVSDYEAVRTAECNIIYRASNEFFYMQEFGVFF